MSGDLERISVETEANGNGGLRGYFETMAALHERGKWPFEVTEGEKYFLWWKRWGEHLPPGNESAFSKKAREWGRGCS